MRILFSVLLAVGLMSCGTLHDAMTPDIPLEIAQLHDVIHNSEIKTVADLEARMHDISKVEQYDHEKYFTQMQGIKDKLGEFAQWLRKSDLDGRLYEATVTRLRVWEDMQAFFCVQDDAYFKHDIPLDEGTKAEVLKYLDFLVSASKKTEKWIDEKGVIEDG